uniref:RRM domain-containing protein n=1 Tax=Leersia perrieri TaxID=77586 RepID=A0A0D9VSJ9_9ORYZ
MALSSSLLRRLTRGSTPVSLSSSASSVLRSTFCSSSSSGPSPTAQSPLSSVFGDDTEVSNVPPLTTPKLFISGLSRLTTDEKLKNAFAPFGQLLEAKVITDRISGRSKGFGFVRYATLEEAENARQEMNAKFLDGWVIFVDPAKPRQQKPAPHLDTDSSHLGFTTNKTVGWCG